jgi:hypothetical protein
MPNRDAPKKLNGIETVDLEIKGWLSPLTIEWGYSFINGHQYLFWHIKDTDHWFKISQYEIEYYEITSIIDHFIKTLEIFRNDYLEWFFLPKEEKTDWMIEYIEIFKDYIKIA